jgi:hypothetical protein
LDELDAQADSAILNDSDSEDSRGVTHALDAVRRKLSELRDDELQSDSFGFFARAGDEVLLSRYKAAEVPAKRPANVNTRASSPKSATLGLEGQPVPAPGALVGFRSMLAAPPPQPTVYVVTGLGAVETVKSIVGSEAASRGFPTEEHANDPQRKEDRSLAAAEFGGQYCVFNLSLPEAMAISQLSALESTKGLRLRSLGGTWGEPLPRSEAGKTDPLTKPIGGRLSNSDAPMVRLVLLALET